MRRMLTGMIVAVVLAVGTGACATAPEPTPVAATGSEDRLVVSHQGVAGVEFGDARAELASEHGLVEATGDCAPRLPWHPGASPVFEGERLVLLWADPPLRTPEGLGVGSPVATVRDTYPGAEPLAAPPESFRFDGLLVGAADRAYLFLHDGTTVQKLIVGFAEHARRLFDEGFGTC